MSTFNLDQEWNEYYPKVYGYFFRRVDNRVDVEDLASLTLNDFFRVMTDEEKRERITSVHSYLWKIAYNHLCDFIKNKQKRLLPVAFDEDFEPVEQAIEAHKSKEYQEKVDKLMQCVRNHLKDLDVKIVEMSILEDRPSKEVAKVLDMTPDNVRQKLSRNLKKLRQKCREIWQA